jgi:hypothetical protein
MDDVVPVGSAGLTGIWRYPYLRCTFQKILQSAALAAKSAMLLVKPGHHSSWRQAGVNQGWLKFILDINETVVVWIHKENVASGTPVL